MKIDMSWQAVQRGVYKTKIATHAMRTPQLHSDLHAGIDLMCSHTDASDVLAASMKAITARHTHINRTL